MLKFAGKLCGGAVFLCLNLAFAQQYSISTVAGGAPPATPTSATGISIGSPNRVATDAAGNLYFSGGNSVFKVSKGTMTLVAGNSRAGFSGDGGPAVNAELNSPQGITIDKASNIYIADSLNNRVRIVTPDGNINTFAGNGAVGQPRFVGDNGPATQANLHFPGGLAVDSSGNLYIADTADNSIREVTTDGLIHTIAGNGFAGYTGDAALAIDSTVNHPQDVTVDSAGNIYIADTGNSLIRKITTDGNINYIAGSVSTSSGISIANAGYSGDNGVATSAGLIEPYGVAVDPAGNVYIAERADGRVRQINTKGYMYTIVGNGTLGFAGDGGKGTSAELNAPLSVALDPSGNLYISDSLNNRVRAVAGAGSGNITTVAGNGGFSYSGDGGPGTHAQFNGPRAVATDAAGNLYIADTVNNVVRKVTTGGTVSTIAGNGTAGFGGDNGAGTSAQLNQPVGVAVDSSGNVYIADTANSRVRKLSGGTITTVAGNGTPGYGGDGGAATSAMLNSPAGLAVDSKGNLYIADSNNSAIRMVTPGGTITTVAGNGRQGYSGDNGAAVTAQLNYPLGVAVDAAGNLYITDQLNKVVRLVSNGIISTIAGNGLPGYSGDGGPAQNAQIGIPYGIAVDAGGGIYVSDGSSVVRKFFLGGPIVTIAGNGTAGYSGDGGTAISAMLNQPSGVAADAQGHVYIADTGNNAVRQLQFNGTGIQISAVTNGASNLTGAISPGEVIVLYGSGLGPAGLVSFQLNNGVLPTSVGGVSVFINGAQAPMLYASGAQIGAIVPFGASGSNAQVYVSYQGQTSAPASVAVAAVSPAIFSLNSSGTGQAAAINYKDGSINGSKDPANAGDYVELYATGLGQTSPTGQDGTVNGVPLPIVSGVTATVGGKPATVNYSGGAPGSPAGVMQVNVQIPAGLSAGNAAIVLQMGGTQTLAGVTVAVSGN